MGIGQETLGFVLDDELYVVGRKKDLIIVAAAQISIHKDVEEIVSTHPAIYDGRVVAFGQYNSNLGTEEIIVVAEVHGTKAICRRHGQSRPGVKGCD